MNNANKTDSKAIATTETAKVINKSVITTQPKIKKPTVDIKKPEVPEKAPVTTDKELVVPTNESGKNNRLIPVVAKPESDNTETPMAINKPVITTQLELKKPTVDVKKPEVPEKAPITTEKESIVPAKESGEPNQLIPIVTKPEPAKTESAKPEKSKNPTKSDKAKVIYEEMVKNPNNDRTTIIAKIKKDLVLTKAGALSYFYKFQKESGNVTEKQPSKMDKAKEVYERMTLEGKSIMHFRYNQKHLDDDIANNLNSYKGKDGVMFFVTGNDPSKPVEERNKQYYSIRKIVIRNVSKSVDTGLVHFYLELGDYYDCSLNSFQSSKFVTRVSVIEGIKNKWIDRVEVVKDYFDDVLFFKYEILTKKNKLIFPTFSELDNDATFHLDDESEYILRCSYFDKLNGKSSLSIADTELLAIHHKESSNIATKIDDRNYKMITNSISHNKTPVQIIFSPNPMPKGDKTMKSYHSLKSERAF